MQHLWQDYFLLVFGQVFSRTADCQFAPYSLISSFALTVSWVRHNPLRTGVGRFHSCLHKRDMPPSAPYECGAEEQTVDHVVLQSPIYRPPHRLHGLTVLDDETTDWLLNTCPEI